MGRYLVVRLYSMGLTLLGLTVLVFLMLRLVPGTVVEQMIGADAVVSPQMVEQLKRFFGLDQPWYEQYARWLGGLVRGDLGTSWRTGKPVVGLILERLPVTLELTMLAVAFALVLGMAAGIVSAIWRGRPLDNVTRVGTLLGLSVPVFWQGTMLILFFSLYLRWMPSVVWVDLWTDPCATSPSWRCPPCAWGRRAPPASPAPRARACSTSCAPSTSARPRPRGWPAAPSSSSTPSAMPSSRWSRWPGLQMGILLGGTVVVEEVFTLPGVGRLVLWSIYQRDYPLTQSTILFIAVMFMTINLAVDLLYSYLDPRIRYGH